MIDNSENEKLGLGYENFNQKFLCNNGVCAVFMNAFDEVVEGKLPMIKSKLRQVLVNFGLGKTYTELCPEVGIVRVYFRDCSAKELKGILLQKYNETKTDQSVELSIRTDVCPAPKKADGQVKTYTGLTKFLFQEFIQQAEPKNLTESLEFYTQLKSLIQKGNQSPPEPLQAIFRGEVE